MEETKKIENKKEDKKELKKTTDKHVVPSKRMWAVRPAGSRKVSKKFETRGEATEYAKELAVKHNVCMVVHDKEGKFERFDCKPEIRNQHVVKKDGSWAVIAEGGKEISQIFTNKGSAMAHAYDIAVKHDVCMLVHDNEGKFKSVACSPNRSPGILEVVRMKMDL
jgi:hypothetical protein